MPEKSAARKRRNGVQAAPGNGSPSNRLELVHEAARAHFSTLGYEAASMRDIAADAGINIATLYFYCSTKEQLLFDVLINAQRQLAEGLREQIDAAGASWSSRLAAAIVVHIKFCAEKAFPTTINRVDMQRLTDEHRATYLAMRDVYEREFRDLIRGGIDAGEFRSVDPKLTTFAILGIGHTVGRWYRADGPLTPEQIAEQYVDFILAGLRAEVPVSR
jgi:TetR/AcrR family transcriptional regulator, cholesterol catabolism regulator